MKQRDVNKNPWKQAEKILNNAGLSAMPAHAGQAGIVVLPTDTLYGIVGSALSKKAVSRIYKIKGRSENKPFIVLINSYKQLEIFGVKITEDQAKILKKFWPGKVSIILPCKLEKWRYLHRKTNSIAFRMIGKRNKNLFNLINKVGPVVAPSANPQGMPSAKTTKEAKNYFSPKQGLGPDLYINVGKRDTSPSKLLKYENGKFMVVRK